MLTLRGGVILCKGKDTRWSQKDQELHLKRGSSFFYTASYRKGNLHSYGPNSPVLMLCVQPVHPGRKEHPLLVTGGMAL